MSHSRQHARDLKTSLATFAEADTATILNFIFRFVDESYLERMLEVQDHLKVPSFLKVKALDQFFSFGKASFYSVLRY